MKHFYTKRQIAFPKRLRTHHESLKVNLTTIGSYMPSPIFQMKTLRSKVI